MLKRSNDSKVQSDSRVKNSFGLPAGRNYSCPGATGICETICYAGRIEGFRPAVLAAMIHNYDLLKDASWAEQVVRLHQMIAEFYLECEKKNVEKIFRIHWDGDFFSRQYASAWATVVRKYPDIQFWVYTRSFTNRLNVIDLIADIDNLAVYLSVDSENIAWAHEIQVEYPTINVSPLGKTMAEAADMVRDIRGTNKPGAKCPELIKAIPLKGACAACKLCVDGKADVRFAFTTAGRK